MVIFTMTNFVVIVVVLNDDYHYDRGNSMALYIYIRN